MSMLTLNILMIIFFFPVLPIIYFVFRNISKPNLMQAPRTTMNEN